MLPTFFGDAERQLFGIYHQATPAAARGVGVVLCYPGPREYRQAHWAFRSLAQRLAAEGFDVLRFDYFATGDSAGDSSEATLEQWVADIATASAELRDMAGVRRIALVGFRLGAALAVRACAAGLSVADLVLWDPIVSGAEYVAGLEATHADFLRNLRYPQAPNRAENEVLGYTMPAAMRTSLEELDLTRESFGRPRRALVASTVDRAADAALHAALAASVPAARVVVPDVGLEMPGDWRVETLLARELPGAIIAHLARKEAA